MVKLIMNNIFTNSLSHKSYSIIAGILVSLLTTGFLRLQLIGNFPETDGGFYTYQTQLIYSLLSNGENLSGYMPLALYPLITSWVYGLEINQFISLRIIDLLVAIVASFILFKVILKESGGSIIFTIALLTPAFFVINGQEYVGSGFKNSIWISYVPLFLALYIWQNLKKDSGLVFYFIGSLTALGVLFREPHFFFFLLGGMSIWIAYGWRNLLKYLIGTAILGFTVTGISLYLRDGNIFNLITSYLNVETGAALSEGIVFKSFIKSGLIVIKQNIFILTTALISIIYSIKLFSKQKLDIKRLLFWLSLSIIALSEPALKFSFPYHFATCIIGLIGLSALGWKLVNLNQTRKFCNYLKGILCILSIALIYQSFSYNFKDRQLLTINDGYKLIQSEIFKNKYYVAKSNYLKSAKIIFENSRENSTLSVSGKMYALFPLTGLLPKDYIITDLTDFFSSINYNEALFVEKLKQYQPTILMVVAASIIRGEKELPRMIEETNIYEKIATIPYDKQLDYGWKHGAIYRLKEFK